MAAFEIWSEGYAATGESGTARFHGSVEAASLKEACIRLAQIDRVFRKDYNEQHNTYWGCQLFDNESDARRSFG